MEYIIPAVFYNVVALIEALAARDRSRAKKQAETLKRHEQQRADETRRIASGRSIKPRATARRTS